MIIIKEGSNTVAITDTYPLLPPPKLPIPVILQQTMYLHLPNYKLVGTLCSCLCM